MHQNLNFTKIQRQNLTEWIFFLNLQLSNNAIEWKWFVKKRLKIFPSKFSYASQ